MERFARHYVAFVAVFTLTIASFTATVGVAGLAAEGIEFSLAQASVTRAVVQVDAQSQAAAVTVSKAQTVAAKVQALKESKKKLSDLSTDVLRKAKSYREGNATTKNSRLSTLRAALQSRKQAMLNAAKNDPEGFLALAFPDGIRRELPKEVENLTEQNVEAEGQLDVYHVDYPEEGRGEFLYELSDKRSGKKYNLRFAKGELSLRTGDKIKAKGTALDSELVMAEAGGDSVTQTSAPSAPNLPLALGEQKTLVIPVEFSDRRLLKFTPEQMRGMMFEDSYSVDNHFREDSYGKTWFTGIVTPVVTIPSLSTDLCFYNTWAQQAKTAVQQLGYDTTTYERFLYMLPGETPCPWGGVSNVGGAVTNSWALTTSITKTVQVMQHELGHALGFKHASTMACGTRSIDDTGNCSVSEYGDVYDIMGYFNDSQSNGPHKLAVPWISRELNLQAVTTGGVYTIAPLEIVTDKVQVLKVVKPYGESDTHFYFSYRQPIGRDVSLPPGLVGGVSVHTWREGINNTYYLDTTTNTFGNFSDAPLSDGKSFVDVIGGVTVKQLSHTNAGATVEVSFGPIQCSRATPSVEVSPINQVGYAGTSLSYNVVVTNNDSLACSNSTFTVRATDLPPGFSASTASVTLKTTERSAAIPINVTSPLSSDSSYPFTVTATDVASSTRTNSASAAFVTGAPAPVMAITGPVIMKSTNTQDITAKVTNSVQVLGLELWKISPLPVALVAVSSTNSVTYKLNGPNEVGREPVLVFQAVARELSGARATSTATHSVTVDNASPQPVFEFPLNDDLVVGGTNIQVNPGDCCYKTFTFSVDGGTMHSGNAANPISFGWNSASTTDNVHALTMAVMDIFNRWGTSTISVTTQNGKPSADTTAPVAIIVAPVNGASLTGNVHFTAFVNENFRINRVEYYVDGVVKNTFYPQLFSSSLTYLWNTGNHINGPHTLEVKAYDDAGNVGTSPTITVTTTNTDLTKPSTSFVAPVLSDSVGATTTITVVASDNVGLKRIDVLKDGVLLGSSATSPYSLVWNSGVETTGTHTLSSVAYDLSNNSATSSISVNVSIDILPPAPPTNLKATATTTTQAYLTWTAPTDNYGVRGYRVYRDDTLILEKFSLSGVTANAYILGLTPETSYTFKVSALDSVKNESTPSAPITFTTASAGQSDFTAPVTSLTSPAAGATVSGTTTVSASASDAVGVAKVELYVDNTLVLTDTSSPYSFSWNTRIHTNGSHTLQTKAYDAAGNVGVSSTRSVTVSNTTNPPSDTTPPSNPSNLTASVISATQINLSWTASTDNVGVAGYKIFRNNVQVATTTTTSFSNTGLTPSTAYTFGVTSFDAAGNGSLGMAMVVANTPALPDTTAPSIPTNLTGSAVSSTQVNLSWNASTDNVGVIGYKLFRDGVQIATPVGTSFSNTTVSPATTYTYTVAATDAAGNTSAQSSGVTVSTPALPDTTLPTTSITSPANGATISNTVTVSATASDNVAVTKVEFYRDGTLVSTDTTAPYALSLDTATLTNGSHTLQTKAYDAANNVGSSVVITVNVSNVVVPPQDTTLPTTLITSPASGATVSGTVTFSASASDNVGVSKVEFYRDGTLLSTDTSSPYSVSLNTTSLTNASHTLQTKAYDAANNVGSSALITITVSNATSGDIVAPTVPKNIGGSVVQSQVNMNWSASTDNVGVVGYKIYRDGVQIATTNLISYSDTNLAQLTTYVYKLAAFDAAGNTSVQSVAFTKTTPDATAPITAIINPINGATVAGTVTLSATASDNVSVFKVEFYRDGVLISTDTSSPYVSSWNTTGATNGSHTLQSKAYDGAGNVSTSNPVTVTLTGGVSEAADSASNLASVVSAVGGGIGAVWGAYLSLFGL